MANDREDIEVLPSAASNSTSNRNVLAFLVLAAVLVIHWRSSWLVNDPLWLDELHSVWVIDQGFTDVFPRAAAGNQAPLYFVIAWLVKCVVYYPATAIRGISAVAGGGLLVLVGWSVWQWTRSKSAVLSSVAVTAFSSSQLFYATEGRPYELLCLVGCWHCLVFVDWMNVWLLGKRVRNVKAICIFALSGLLAVLIQPVAVLLLAAEGIAICVVSVIRRKGELFMPIFSAVIAFSPAGLMFLVLTAQLWHTVENRDLWASVVSIDLTLTDLMRTLVVPALCMVVAAIGNRRLKLEHHGQQEKTISSVMKWRIAASFLMLNVLAVLIACGLTRLEIAPLALPRYGMAIGAAPFLAVGLAISLIRSRGLRMASAVCVVGSMFFLPLPNGESGSRHLETLSGFGWNGSDVSFAGYPLRNEPWEEAWTWTLTRSRTTYLLGNILEDDLLEPGLYEAIVNGESVAGITLRQYLSFPFVGLDPEKDRVGLSYFEQCPIPTRTVNRPRFLMPIDGLDVRYPNVAGDSGQCLVIRGSPELAEDIEEEFVSKIIKSNPNQHELLIERNRFGNLSVLYVRFKY